MRLRETDDFGRVKADPAYDLVIPLRPGRGPFDVPVDELQWIFRTRCRWRTEHVLWRQCACGNGGSSNRPPPLPGHRSVRVLARPSGAATRRSPRCPPSAKPPCTPIPPQRLARSQPLTSRQFRHYSSIRLIRWKAHNRDFWVARLEGTALSVAPAMIIKAGLPHSAISYKLAESVAKNSERSSSGVCRSYLAFIFPAKENHSGICLCASFFHYALTSCRPTRCVDHIG